MLEEMGIGTEQYTRYELPALAHLAMHDRRIRDQSGSVEPETILRILRRGVAREPFSEGIRQVALAELAEAKARGYRMLISNW
jgi:hypothetical protein